MEQPSGDAVPGGWLRRSIPPALQYSSYRAYWLGMLASVSGFQMFRVALAWLVYELTDSPLYLGYAAAATALPGIVFNLLGGVVADKLDKRRLVFATQAVTAGLILLLAVLTMQHLVQPWHVLVIAFLAGAVEAFDTPARQALYPHLIERRVMVSAVAMNSVIWQSTRIVAPAVAGFIIDLVNTAAVFYLGAFGFLVMTWVMYRLNVPHIPGQSRGNPARDLLDGLAYVRKNSIFSFLIGMTFFNSFFGMAYVMVMPIFAVDILEVGARGQGLLLGVSGVGSLLTTLWLGSRSNVRYKGQLIIGGSILFGLTLATFAATSQLLGLFSLAMALLFFMGIFNSSYMISIQSSLQLLVPDRMRGRVMGFYGMTWSIMPLGGTQAGALANVIGAPLAIMIGGLAVVAFAAGSGLLNRSVWGIGSLLEPLEAGGPEASVPATRASSPGDG